MKIYLNGKLVGKKDARISVFDHGLLYGDGVFEGIRAYHGKVFYLEEHIDRLFKSAKAICLEIPMTKAAKLPPEELADKILTGILYEDKSVAEFQQTYIASARAQQEAMYRLPPKEDE